ncbi:adenosine receptor A1-like [Montipora foliosa]|uniref:adenosine receptor A1-like n=1 Tax=Montipora foliosa TaxID=591990 RepID=UPI0035F1E16B
MSNSSSAASNIIPRGFLVSQIILSFLLATPAVFSNVILLYTIHRRKLWRMTATLLVVNLSVSDFLTGLVTGCGSLYYDINLFLGRTREELSGSRLVITFAAVVTNIVASCTISVMAFDRLFAVSSPLRYKMRVTPKKIKVFIAVIWIYSFLFSSLAMVLPQNVFVLLYCHLHVTLPILVLSAVYWRTYYALRSHNEQVRNISGRSDEQMTVVHRERERRMISAFLIVLILFYVTFAPQYIVQNMLVAQPSFALRESFRFFLYVANKFLLVNCSLNPFVYAWRIPRYRKAFREEFRKCRCRKKRQYNVSDAFQIIMQVSSTESDPTQGSSS